MHGFYLVIVAEFFVGGSRLWVQWMASRDDDGRTKALHTLSPLEFNEYHSEMTFDGFLYKETEVGTTLQLTAEDGHSGESFRVNLDVFHKLGAHALKKERVQGVRAPSNLRFEWTWPSSSAAEFK